MRSVVAALALAMVAASARAAPEAAHNLNVINFILDDWGWGDIGAYGASWSGSGTKIRTPNLDKLAAQGTLFTQYKVSQGFCAPSRFAIMTSRFPAEYRFNCNPSPSKEMCDKCGVPYYMPLPPQLPNLANFMKTNGYYTAHLGKWHWAGYGVEGFESPQPSEYGFDETATFGSGIWVNKSRVTAKDRTFGEHGDPWWSANTSQTLLNELKGAITNARTVGKPFFINAWAHMSHDTLDPSPDQMALFPFNETCPYSATMAGQHLCARQVYWSSQTQFDIHFGELMDWIDSTVGKEKVLILLTTDNGPQTHHVVPNAVGMAGPFRGAKASIYEAGIRVPFIARWPGRIPANRIDHSVIGGVDILPTVLDATGIPLPEGHWDGESALHALLGAPGEDIPAGRAASDAAIVTRSFNRTKPLLWLQAGEGPLPCTRDPPLVAALQDRYKLLFNPSTVKSTATGAPLTARVELYDVDVSDPQQTTQTPGFYEYQNLAADLPGEVAKLRAPLEAWVASLNLTGVPIGPHEGCWDYPVPGRPGNLQKRKSLDERGGWRFNTAEQFWERE